MYKNENSSTGINALVRIVKFTVLSLLQKFHVLQDFYTAACIGSFPVPHKCLRHVSLFITTTQFIVP